MQFVKLPNKILKTINKIQRNFIWGTTADKKKLHMLSWETVSLTKERGGLGLQKCENRNKATHTSLA